MVRTAGGACVPSSSSGSLVPPSHGCGAGSIRVAGGCVSVSPRSPGSSGCGAGGLWSHRDCGRHPGRWFRPPHHRVPQATRPPHLYRYWHRPRHFYSRGFHSSRGFHGSRGSFRGRGRR
jgi:hypothetical protein